MGNDSGFLIDRKNVVRAPCLMRHGPPGIVIWFKVYATCLSLCNIALAVLGIWLMIAINPVVPFLTEDTLAAISLRGLGIILCVAGLVFMSLPAVSIFTTDQTWAWSYNLGMLIFGLLFSFFTCCVPIALVCIPILFGWFNTEVWEYYDIGPPKPRRKYSSGR